MEVPAVQVVHLRVNDSSTGMPTPVRIHLATPDGRYLPPLGRLADFPLDDGRAVGGQVLVDGKPFACVDGSCEVRLPAGMIHVQVCKGLEYQPLQTTVLRHPGQIAIRLNIERRVRLEEQGWFAGDTHAQFLSPQAAALEGAAEGLHLVNLLASAEPDGERITYPGLLDFSGQKPIATLERCQVVVNTLNRGGSQGDLALLNAHRIVFPLRLGEEGFENYTLTDWCRQCHRKGGLVVRVRFPHGDEGPKHETLYHRDVDAVEWTGDDPFEAGLAAWYRLLNRGLRVALVGGSGKRSNRTVLGQPRTYARLAPGEPFSYGAWIEAVRAGRTFVTRGPLLRFEVDDGGLTSSAQAGKRMMSVQGDVLRAHVSLWIPEGTQRMELVHNGEVVADAAGDQILERELVFDSPGWLAARCRQGNQLTAHTSPVYVT
ncbi:MAG: CehA/McbA family metallohydrolase [Gemmatales bacterium]|nr:CehA/McbA family metallohydrolase [Gemmatales bacterium]MDW8385997.1 CehA/McbA family metallohydrolase [Gemmatales bacterium]